MRYSERSRDKDTLAALAFIVVLVLVVFVGVRCSAEPEVGKVEITPPATEVRP